jgi:Tol biopolymer transport system component
MMRQIAGTLALGALFIAPELTFGPDDTGSASELASQTVVGRSVSARQEMRLSTPTSQAPPSTESADTRETRLANVKQLTHGGENAEAYFSPDGSRLIFQRTQPPDLPCDQILTMTVDGTDVRRVSTGTGRTTCGFFYPDSKGIVFASTHLRSPECPPRPGYERGYVWPVYPGYDIFRASLDGSHLQRLTSSDGYDAEATIGPGGRIVFTSVRDGDMEIYSMNGDGSNVRRLTNRPGPDGGPFFSPDGTQIVFRGRVSGGEELADYQALLKEGLWRPTSLEIFVMDADGTNIRQVTTLGKASFAPYFHPDGRRIVFSSNVHDPKGRDFDLYMIDVNGSGLERITWNPTFDGFPMFSPDGKRLVFASNRNAAKEGDTNVFIADWIEKP